MGGDDRRQTTRPPAQSRGICNAVIKFHAGEQKERGQNRTKWKKKKKKKNQYFLLALTNSPFRNPGVPQAPS